MYIFRRYSNLAAKIIQKNEKCKVKSKKNNA